MEYSYKEMDLMMKEFPFGTIIRNLVIGKKFIVDGYIYSNIDKMWHVVHEINGAWYTPEQFKEFFD